MRYALLAFMVAFMVTCALIVTADDEELAGFDPFRPASVLQVLADRAQKVPPLLRDFIGEFTTPLRHRVERTTTFPPKPR